MLEISQFYPLLLILGIPYTVLFLCVNLKIKLSPLNSFGIKLLSLSAIVLTLLLSTLYQYQGAWIFSVVIGHCCGGFIVLFFIQTRPPLGMSVLTELDLNTNNSCITNGACVVEETEPFISRWKEIVRQPRSVSASPPANYIRENEGNTDAASKMWQKTLEWREKSAIDGIMKERQPLFHTIKKYSPHYWHGRDRKGHPVYYDLLGRIDVRRAVANGVNVERYIRHCIFCAEFLWNVIEPDDSAQMIAVMDVQGLGLTSLSGYALEIFQNQSKINAAHYPGRNFKTFIVNAPSWFSLIFPIILKVLDKKTQQNLTVLNYDYTLLHKAIGKENLPFRYGGSSGELGTSTEERAIAEVVQLNNARFAESSGLAGQ